MNKQHKIKYSPLFLLAFCSLTVAPTFAQTITHVPLFTFGGESTDDQFGLSVSGAGDVNGDGFADVIVGAPSTNSNAGTRIGSARVFSGITGDELYRFGGDFTNGRLGSSVSGAGDVNSDGFADLIVAGSTSSGGPLVFSGADGSELYGFDDFGTLGRAVSGAGDVNGDGVADLILGATPPNNGAGSSRVFSGINGNELYTFEGEFQGDSFGRSVSGAGDVNNDGFDDLIVGAQFGANGRSIGNARVLSGVDGSEIYTFLGDPSTAFLGDFFGVSVSGAGDVNNDGFDDLIVGASNDDNNGLLNSGSARVFSGFDGNVLFSFNGDSAGESLGHSVSDVGDVNGDGFDDLIVGSFGDDVNGVNSGRAQVFSGADGSVIYTFNGDSANDQFGWSVSGAGDVNGDGLADFFVGAPSGPTLGGDGYARLFVSQVSVPEPSALSLLLLGSIGLISRRTRRVLN